jgi:hypothetical protein
MRPRIYPTAAERQKAYRDRKTERPTTTDPPPRKPRRPPSRPARLAALTEALRSLQAEYEGWLEALPESLANSDLAERLQAAVKQLDAAADLLGEIDLPRGFGRD